MAEVGKVSEDAILRFARFSAVESAAATFTEQELATNLSLERGVLWQIRWIEVHMPPGVLTDDAAANSNEAVTVQITRETKSALVNFNDADLIALFHKQLKRANTIGTDAGPMYWTWDSPIRQAFDPAILYASPSIFVAVQSTEAAAVTVRGRIAYTLAKADEKLFFRVAQALIG